MIEVTPEMLQYALGAVGAGGLAWALWPGVQWAWARLPAMGGQTSVATYEQAIHYLAMVRTRVKETGLLGDDQRRAVDVLTLALVDGCDGRQPPEVANAEK